MENKIYNEIEAMRMFIKTNEFELSSRPYQNIFKQYLNLFGVENITREVLIKTAAHLVNIIEDMNKKEEYNEI